MINYGVPPGLEEIEVTVFGPGYGEAIAVHLGDGMWLLIDSCIDPDSKSPASSTYLEQIGVHVDQVRIILATHWDDDHVRGISQLAEHYPDADFMISAVFNNEDATAFLSAYSGLSSSGLSRGTKELFSVVKAREVVIPVLSRTNVYEAVLGGQSVRVTALSPVPEAFAQFVKNMAQYLPRINQAINHAPEIRPNYEAVVLHIDTGDDAILLGADLEDHDTFGWSAVMSDKSVTTRQQATVYKVAHHGSITGDCPDIWATLLRENPIACLTPFANGRHRLPKDTDKIRIKQNSLTAYISSGASRRPNMDSRQLKRLGDICKNISRVNAGFGAVRLRKKRGALQWNVELFGAAQAL